MFRKKAIRRVDWITIPVDVSAILGAMMRPAPIGRHWANVLHQSTGKHTLRDAIKPEYFLLAPRPAYSCVKFFSWPLRPVRVFIDELPQNRLI